MLFRSGSAAASNVTTVSAGPNPGNVVYLRNTIALLTCRLDLLYTFTADFDR